MIRELRFTGSPEVRADASGRSISGYASVFNSRTQIGDFMEQVKPGAFARAIREKQDVACLFNHDPNLVLGRVSAGSLSLKEDSRGLHFTCDVSLTTFGNDALQLIRRGDVGKCSFGFIEKNSEWTEIAGASGPQWLRSILDADLYDVSPVTYPAYDSTSVGLDERSLANLLPAGVPSSMPIELRSRMNRAAIPVSPEEQLERKWARDQAERILRGL